MPVWKPIFSWDGIYEVSDEGQVRSLDRIVQTAKGPQHWKSKILSTKIAAEDPGYVLANLSSPQRRETRYVHEIVLSTFIGPRPLGMEGCHFDDNALNNRLSNLRWDYVTGNHADALRNGLIHHLHGVDVPSAKLTLEDVAWIRQNSGLYSRRALGRKFGVSHSRICAVVNGESYKG